VSLARSLSVRALAAKLLLLAGTLARQTTVGAESDTNSPPEMQSWNWHVQNTVIVQGDPGFPAIYSGPNSLDSQGEVRETVSLDLYAGARLWSGAEAFVDGLMWQGFGLSKTLGIEAFPSGEAFRLGTKVPNVTFARLFLRQTFGLAASRKRSKTTNYTWRDARMYRE